MVIPDGYGQLNFIFTGQAVPTGAQVTFGFQNSLEKTFGEVLGAIASAIGEVDFGQFIENDSELSTALIKLGPSATGPSGEAPVGLTGDAGSDGTAPNLALLVKRFTAAGGRSGSGRLFWPFVMTSWLSDDGSIGAGTVTSVTDEFNAFSTAMAGHDLPLFLLHSESSPVELPTEITGFLCDPLAATQRRRMRR